MNGLRLEIGAKSFLRSFRTFFYLCTFLLLPLYSVPETGLATSETPKKSHAAGMDAPPPPLLESHTRLASLSSPERRLFGALPLAQHLGVLKRTWPVSLPLLTSRVVNTNDLAMFQQWQLEGG